MPYMAQGAARPPYRETVLYGEGARLEILLWPSSRGPACRIEYRSGERLLLSYAGDAQDCERSLRGRAAPYRFRSVEQLRYDLERDIAEIGLGA